MPTFKGQVSRGGNQRADRLPQVAAPRPDAAARRGVPAARRHASHQHASESHEHRHPGYPTAAPAPAPVQAARDVPQRHARRDVLAADQGPQAHRHPLPDHGHGDVLHRRPGHHHRPPQPDDARRRSGHADTYNKLFTMHGVIMVFFFLVPVVPTVLGNFCLPLMIGAKDLAFPRINLASWYLFMIGGVWALYAMLAGGVDTGWTFYTPYSSQSSHYNVVPALIGIVISRLLVHLHRPELHRHRPPAARPGMTWWRLPIFVWTIYATSFIFLLATPVLAMALILVIIERLLQHRHLRPGAGRRPAAVPAPVLVLLAPGRLHHDPARHGHRQRGHPLLRPQEPVRLHGRGPVELRHRRASASWSGRTTCSWPASRCTRP